MLTTRFNKISVKLLHWMGNRLLRQHTWFLVLLVIQPGIWAAVSSQATITTIENSTSVTSTSPETKKIAPLQTIAPVSPNIQKPAQRTKKATIVPPPGTTTGASNSSQSKKVFCGSSNSHAPEICSKLKKNSPVLALPNTADPAASMAEALEKLKQLHPAETRKP